MPVRNLESWQWPKECTCLFTANAADFESLWLARKVPSSSE